MPYASLPFPFLGDSFDPNDIYSSGYPVNSEPPAFLIQAMRALSGSTANSFQTASSDTSRETRSSQPLMIELQGDRYVTVDSKPIDGEALPLDFHSSSNGTAKLTRQAKTSQSALASAPVALTPAVLIFRDGHREEVGDYTIADGTIYVRGDYYSDGYWNKKIEISSLNLTQTQQANRDRNVKFVLPSFPNEVITRP